MTPGITFRRGYPITAFLFPVEPIPFASWAVVANLTNILSHELRRPTLTMSTPSARI